MADIAQQFMVFQLCPPDDTSKYHPQAMMQARDAQSYPEIVTALVHESYKQTATVFADHPLHVLKIMEGMYASGHKPETVQLFTVFQALGPGDVVVSECGTHAYIRQAIGWLPLNSAETENFLSYTGMIVPVAA